MGIAVGDLNGDRRPDLFLTHLALEHNTLYLSDAHGQFFERSQESGLARHDWEHTGFGCGFLDMDHDGDLDLAVVNGRVRRASEARAIPGGGFWSAYAEADFLLLNNGDGTFINASTRAGAFAARAVSRGLAFGDLDGDGDLDLAATHADNTLHLYRNDAPGPDSHWLLVRALSSQRDAFGAVVSVRAGDRSFSRVVLAGTSYGSSSDPRTHFGLGAAENIDAIEVLWPDGHRETFPGSGVDRILTLRQGEGS